MSFFAGRRNGGTDVTGLGPSGLPPPLAGGDSPGGVPVDGTGLPPWVESAVRKLLASVLPQFQPLITKTEAVLADAGESLATLRADQKKTQAEFNALRLALGGSLNSLRQAQVETMTQLAALKTSVDRLALLSGP